MAFYQALIPPPGAGGLREEVEQARLLPESFTFSALIFGGVWLLFIPEGRSLVPGMTVSTAMISEILPPGIPIGRLSEQKKRSEEGFVSYRLETGASLSLLYSVSVLRPKAR